MIAIITKSASEYAIRVLTEYNEIYEKRIRTRRQLVDLINVLGNVTIFANGQVYQV